MINVLVKIFSIDLLSLVSALAFVINYYFSKKDVYRFNSRSALNRATVMKISAYFLIIAYNWMRISFVRKGVYEPNVAELMVAISVSLFGMFGAIDKHFDDLIKMDER